MAIAAEHNIQAVFQTQRATIKYIDASNGEWPNSWEDLALAEPGFDFEWVASQIEFEFNCDPAVLAKLRPDEFKAIKQKNEYYDIEPELKTIIVTLRKYHW